MSIVMAVSSHANRIYEDRLSGSCDWYRTDQMRKAYL